MRLILITQDFLPTIGGIQTYSDELAKRLTEKCEYFCLVAPDHEDAAVIDAQLPYEVKRIDSRETLIGWVAIKVLSNFIKKKNIDTFFHAQWTTLPISILMKSCSVIDKIIVATHGRELLFNPFENNIIMRNIYIAYRRLSFIFVDLFLPVSHFTAELLENDYVKKNKICVVINGTSPGKFYPLDTKKIKLEKGLHNKKILLTIARLVERKGIDTVLKALPKVVNSHPELLYMVVGDGEYLKDLKELAVNLQLLDYIKFCGKATYSELNTYYNICDIFVMPSKTNPPDVEGFGLVFLEANACSKPVVGTKTGGIPSAIIHGETGMLVKEDNSVELAKAINMLLEDPALANKLGENGRKRVLKEANWDSVSDKVFRLLNENKI